MGRLRATHAPAHLCGGERPKLRKCRFLGMDWRSGGKSPGGGRRDPLGKTRGGARARGPLEVRHSQGGAPRGSPQGTLEALLGENMEEERRDVLRD